MSLTPPSPSLQRADILDPALVDQLRTISGRNGVTLLDELVEKLAGSLVPTLYEIRAAVERAQPLEAVMLAHRTAGSVGTLGARGLAHSLTRWEARARAGESSETLIDVLMLLMEQVEAVEAELARLQASLPSAHVTVG